MQFNIVIWAKKVREYKEQRDYFLKYRKVQLLVTS